jgi:hypothetical protein
MAKNRKIKIEKKVTETPADVLTETQAAVFLHQQPRTLRLWRTERGLPHFKVSNKVVLYYRADLLEWLQRRRVAILA